jgi:hypothetical protein
MLMCFGFSSRHLGCDVIPKRYSTLSMIYNQKTQTSRNASAYPEITTASIEGPEATDGALKYRFTRALGTKG